MKKKNIVLIGITILLLLITVIGATYAYFISYNPANIQNISATANIGSSNSVFTSIGNNVELSVNAINMEQKRKGSIAASSQNTITVSYLSGSNEELECTYDIYYKWKDTSDDYIRATNEYTNEFTYKLSYNESQIVNETNFVNSTDTSEQLIYSDSIKNNSELVASTKTYTIDLKFYNAAYYDQTSLADKNWKIEFYVDNVVCGEAKSREVYAYLYQTTDANNYELVLRNTLNGDEESLTGLSNDNSFNAKATLLGNDLNKSDEVKTLDNDRTLISFYGDISKGFSSPVGSSYSYAGKVKTVNIETEIYPTNTVNYFYGLSNVNSIIGLENLDTSRVTNMHWMFKSFGNNIELNLNSFNTSKVRDMSNMFESSYGITNLNVSNFDTRNVRDMHGLFYSVTLVRDFDLSGWNTSNVTNMQELFYFTKNMVNLNISSFDTSKVKDMWGMFYDVRNLQTLNLSHFDTSNVENMALMFYCTYNLSSLDISNFNTSKVKNMATMFRGADNLISLDISHFDTSNVTNMSEMFATMDRIQTLNLQNLNVSATTNVSQMFWGSDQLTTITATSGKWNAATVINGKTITLV